ncbi:uncharacterized protein LOC125040858 [Penaeus chinensis]|uniref:uncharacterized protein LOC125040858 n=1 Tax=Penaeus chinensis TaxID=139456 RepID=UPI001FB6F1FB|nr:uncharacterized protein LOC125040858 [Penaeus chinensis]
MGVFTRARLPPGLVFGPYEGHIRTDSQESGYAWQVRSPSHKKKTVDSVDASVSNWMRYVNCSKTDAEANLEGFQFLGNIYYLVITYIEFNSELLVWYGDDFGKALQSRRDVEAGVRMTDDQECGLDKKKIKTEDVAEVHGKTLSLSQREMEPLFTPVVLKRTPDGSAQVQIAESETPDSRLLSRRSPKKAPQQYRKFDCTYCVVCKRAFRGICSKHPMPLLRDAPVPRDGSVKERAKLTAPWPLVVRQSRLKAAGEGVVTTARLPKGLVLGPCEGWVLPRTSATTGYSWEIDGRPDVEIDAADTAFSNWPRYLNCPRSDREQNLRPMQIRGEIFYVTTADIEQNTELLVWYGNDYGTWLTFPQLLPVDGNDHLGAARGTRQRGHSTRRETRSQTCARDREPRHQDKTQGGATGTAEGPAKGPLVRRRQTSAEDNRRKIARVRCPTGYTSIVELGLEKTRNKRRGFSLRARASTEGIPSCWKLQPDGAPDFPMALSAEAVCDKCHGDSRFKAFPGTREMFPIFSIDNREFSQKEPVKEASPANTCSVREVFPCRREDTSIEGSPAGASHQSLIGYSNLQEQKLKVEWTEDLCTNSSAKLRLPSESNSAREVPDMQRIILEEKVREPCTSSGSRGMPLH